MRSPRRESRTARKDYPGIKKGEKYYYTCIKTGPRSSRELRSKTPFRRSQLTSSDFLSQAYDLSDSVADIATKEEIADLISSFESLRDEQQEKLDNMPEGLQQGATGELLQERIDQCESIIGELETIDSELEDDASEEAVREALAGVTELF
jgi:hypothetical protein